jgi:integrase
MEICLPGTAKSSCPADLEPRVVCLTFVLTGVRISELQALRWADVDLLENVLKVRDSKSEDGIRSIALSPPLPEELWQHRRSSAFQGDDERVFCHPERGSVYRGEEFTVALQAAFAKAGLARPEASAAATTCASPPSPRTRSRGRIRSR